MPTRRRQSRSKPRLLSGGNPQIAKADGDAPVRAYVGALDGWKRDVVTQIDAILAGALPGVRRAVRWNSPMYGIPGQGWFASLHVFNTFVKVTFFKGASLRPMPPGGTSPEARWVNVTSANLDERQLTRWAKQAAAIRGWGSS